MYGIRLVLTGLLALGLCSAAAAEEKKNDNAKLIVGAWELTKGETLPPGSEVEFTKDGKLKLTVEPEKGKKIVLEGTYEIKGDSFVAILKQDGKENKETLKIKTLTEQELTVVDEKGKADSFKRKK